MINNIYKLFLDEIDFFEKNSGFTHKDSKNIRASGDLTEIAIRKLLKEIIGNRFRVTHGYIYSPLNKQLSPQIDVIITDTLVPDSFKKFEYLDNMEIVPAEAVVGIFEIKRKLTNKTYEEALSHLQDIIVSVPIRKDLDIRYFTGGAEVGIGMTGGFHSNPLIGVISLLHETDDKIRNKSLPSFIDIIFSFSGYLRAYQEINSPNLRIINCRTIDDNYPRVTIEIGNFSREQILMLFVNFLHQYLKFTGGRLLEPNEYFR